MVDPHSKLRFLLTVVANTCYNVDMKVFLVLCPYTLDTYTLLQVIMNVQNYCINYYLRREFMELVIEILRILEIPASRVFLGANAQLLETSLAGVKMPYYLSLSLLKLNIRSSALPRSAPC